MFKFLFLAYGWVFSHSKNDNHGGEWLLLLVHGPSGAGARR